MIGRPLGMKCITALLCYLCRILPTYNYNTQSINLPYNNGSNLKLAWIWKTRFHCIHRFLNIKSYIANNNQKWILIPSAHSHTKTQDQQKFTEAIANNIVKRWRRYPLSGIWKLRTIHLMRYCLATNSKYINASITVYTKWYNKFTIRSMPTYIMPCIKIGANLIMCILKLCIAAQIPHMYICKLSNTHVFALCNILFFSFVCIQ